jgi:hypothetical protein
MMFVKQSLVEELNDFLEMTFPDFTGSINNSLPDPEIFMYKKLF